MWLFPVLPAHRGPKSGRSHRGWGQRRFQEIPSQEQNLITQVIITHTGLDTFSQWNYRISQCSGYRPCIAQYLLSTRTVTGHWAASCINYLEGSYYVGERLWTHTGKSIATVTSHPEKNSNINIHTRFIFKHSIEMESCKRNWVLVRKQVL